MNNNYNLDLRLISKELRVLLEILKQENEVNKRLYNLIKDMDWEYFLQLARHHRVYPLLYSKLKKIDENIIPEYVLRALYKEYKNNTFHMLHLCGEMVKISKLFTENNIPVLFLKGPVIAADLYGDISLRTSKDLDILIPIKNLENAEALLLHYGYEREENLSLLNEWKWRSHHVTYFHPQKNIYLEIHWRLQSRPSREPLFNELWERKRTSPFENYPIYFLGKTDLFLFLVSHGARHGWFRLRWLIDIDKILRKGIKSEEYTIFVNEYQNQHMVGQALILASQLLNTPINEEMQKLTKENRSRNLAQSTIFFLKEMSSLETIMSTKYYKSYLFSLKSKSQKFFFILKFFYPGYEDTKIIMLPKSLHFLYFPLRPFFIAWRKIHK